jgi:thiamine monophosphate synthase
VLAIGGITTGRIGEVMAAGACGVAGISLFDRPGRVP